MRKTVQFKLENKIKRIKVELFVEEGVCGILDVFLSNKYRVAIILSSAEEKMKTDKLIEKVLIDFFAKLGSSISDVKVL